MGRDIASALRARCHGLSAGIFAANAADLGASVAGLAGWGGDLLHFDVMDGVFVPQITAGPAFVAALGAGMLRDVHLMVASPLRHVAAFARAGADLISVQAEAPDAAEALVALRQAEAGLARPILAGLAVMPGTPLESLGPLLALQPDLILVLAVDPRNSAPADLDLANQRLRLLREMTKDFAPLLAIDGGVTTKTIALAAATGPDVIVSGSAIFGATDPSAAFAALAEGWAQGQTKRPGGADA